MSDNLLEIIMRSTVWVTRTNPFNRLTAKHLLGHGYQPVIAPALRIVPWRASGPIAVPDAFVFTSLQGVRLHRFLPALADLPVFAVGDHTASFARARGYRNVVSAGGDVGDLCRILRQHLRPGTAILHIGAARPAGDLGAMLAPDRITVRRLAVYDVVEAGLLELEWVAGQLYDIDKILIHSPRAGRLISRWLELQAPRWQGEILCISPAAAEPFGGLPRARISIAERPRETSLLAPLFDAARQDDDRDRPIEAAGQSPCRS